MKILRLALKNFSHIYSGLGKYSIDLDFSKTHKTINVIIGKMGSCKTVILGHLQPFATFGTLDVRNQDEIIIPGKNGQKILIVQDGENIYWIQHEYIWKKDHHLLKSYIKKNGTELNESGSVTNFKSLVELELGMDQSFLVLLRLGSNVTNLIDMKAAERKAFMASMLSKTEIYQILYKKLNEDMRNLNAQATMLIKKISSLSKGNLEEMKIQYGELKEDISDYTDNKNNLQKVIYEIDAEMKVLLKGKSVSNFHDELMLHRNESTKLENEITDQENELNQAKSQYDSIQDVAKVIGGIEAQLIEYQKQLTALNETYTENIQSLSKLKDHQLLTKNPEQIESMKSQYEVIVNLMDSMDEELKGFRCDYNSTTLKSTLGQINTINLLINELSDYNHESVMSILSHGISAIKWASKQIDICNAKKLKLQAEINNLKFVGQYKTTEDLVIPKECPCAKKCPYYKTHPETLQKDFDTSTIDKQFTVLQNQIYEMDSDIGRLSEYPIIFNKLSTLKSIWDPTISMLQSIGVAKTTSITKVLETIYGQLWYYRDEFMSIIEKCEHREKYYELTEKSSSLKAEIINLDRFNDKELLDRIVNLEKNNSDILSAIQSIEALVKELKSKKKGLDDIYLELSSLADIEKEITDKKNTLDLLHGVIKEMEDSEEAISLLASNRDESAREFNTIAQKLSISQSAFESLQIALNDISYAQQEFDDLKNKQEALHYIVEAVSSNKGIPLVYIQLFLRDCKETLNDLISDVFGDSIEVLDFIINENEFRIPYAINGSVVEDISKASQGQKAIISLALSFALIRQAHSKWNIMLLDEMDGPLYKDDRNKFITILYKQLSAINAEQVFLISHNFTFDGQNVNVIMTTEEHLDKSSMISIMHA